MKKESEFNADLYKIGLRVPIPICYAKSDENDYFFQEKIKGIDLSQLVNENRIDELPDNFDFHDFFKVLNADVKKMNDAGYHHLDLHLGNIMIDENGRPVIIDFGDTVKQSLSTDDPYRYRDARGNDHIKPKDINVISQNRVEVGNYLKEMGWFKKN